MTTTTVRFPALDATPDGSALLVDLLVELVGANGRPLVGATTPDGGAVTCSAAATLTYDAEDDPPSVGVDFDLTPQDQIASPDGRATWYRVTLDADPGAGPSVWLVQVPTSAEVVTFGSLIAGAAVDAADLAAGRLLPLTTGADPGDGLVLDADLVPRWSAAGGGGVSSLTWGAITGTLSAQTDLSSALSGKETSGAAAAAVSAHAAASDPHPGYRLESASIALADLAQGGAVSGQALKWSGSAWTPGDDASGGGGVSLGETETTAYRGDRGKAAYDHSQSAHAPSDATAAGATGDAFATSHLAAFSHANIANGQTAYGWGNHASAGYALSSSLGTAAASAATDFAPAAKGVTNGDSHDHNGGDGAQIAYSSLSGVPSTFAPAAHASSHATGQADALTASAIGALPIWSFATAAPTTGNVTGVVNTFTSVDISNITAARNFVLPTCAAGDRCAVRVSVTNATVSRELLIVGDTGVTVNGVAAGTEWSRIWQAGEFVIFVAIASNAWIVEHDGRIPCIAHVRRASGSLTTSSTAAAWTAVAPDTIVTNRGGMVSGSAPYTVTPRRGGQYTVELFGYLTSITDGKRVQFAALDGSSNILVATPYDHVAVNGTKTVAVFGEAAASAGTTYSFNVRSEEASKAVSLDASFPKIVMREVLP